MRGERMKLKKLLLLGLAVSLLASCQKHFEEEHLKYDVTKSKALNIALLTGLTTVEHGSIVDSEPVGHSSNGGKGAAMTAGAFDLLTGGGGLGLMTSFMFNIYQPEWENHVFAWMPQDMAKDEEEAASVMSKLIDKAIKSSLPKGTEIIKNDVAVKYKAFSDDTRTTLFYREGSGSINGVVTEVYVPRKVNGNANFNALPSYYWSYMKTSSDTSPLIKVMPALDGDFWQKRFLPEFYKEKKITPLMRIEAQRKLLAVISKNLPSWVYIYIAPNLKTKEPAYFLNQGKKLYFIKPAS